MNILLRRRKLGNGSCTGIQAASFQRQLVPFRNDGDFSALTGLRYIFRWGCTSTVPDSAGAVVVNSAESIHWCSNKRAGRLAMQAAGVSVPETWGVNADGTIEREGNTPLPADDVPVVARPNTHSQGRNLFYG